MADPASAHALINPDDASALELTVIKTSTHHRAGNTDGPWDIRVEVVLTGVPSEATMEDVAAMLLHRRFTPEEP